MSKETKIVRFFSKPIELANELIGIHGSTFLKVLFTQDMSETDARGQLKRMKKTNNPFLNSGVVKYSITQLTTNFDYGDKVERRGGEVAETQGNWHTRLIANGQYNPVSIHKGDIITELTTDPTRAKLDKTGNIADCLQNRRPVLDENKNVQFTTPLEKLQLYILAEPITDGEGPRQEQKMRSKSFYQDRNGNIIEKSDIEPYLKTSGPRTDETNTQTFALSNVIEMTIGGVTYRRVDCEAFIPKFEQLQASV